MLDKCVVLIGSTSQGSCLSLQRVGKGSHCSAKEFSTSFLLVAQAHCQPDSDQNKKNHLMYHGDF